MSVIWSGPRLLVPMAIDALVLGTPNVTGAAVNGGFVQVGFDYSALRFNQSPTPKPFAAPSDSGVPKVGAELHWTLPAGLRSASADYNDGEFPLLPNRWIVVRAHTPAGASPNTAPVLTAWLLQSDRIDPDNGTVTWPAPDDPAKFTWMGVEVQLLSSIEDEASTVPRVRAMGPGNAAFAQVYQGLENVLAFHDELADVAPGTISYTVIGFYNPSSWDPLLQASDSQPNGFTNEEQWSAQMERLRLQVGETGSAGELEVAQAAWDEWRSAHGMDPSNLPPAQQELPAQVLFHGSVQQIEWLGPSHAYTQAIPPSADVEVAVGNNPTEALGAWLNNKLTDRKLEDYSIERLLEALMTDRLTDFMNDVVGFENAQHDLRFSSISGGTAWTVERAANQNPNAKTSLPLDATQTDALIALSAQQSALEQAQRAQSSRAWELFAANWKATQSNGKPYSTQIQAAISSLTSELGTLGSMIGQAQDGVTALAAKLRSLLGSSYALGTAKQDAFRAPNDPVVLVSSAKQDDKILQRDLDNQDVDLFCRMTGQTVVSMQVRVDGANPTTLATSDLLAALDLSFLSFVTLPKESRDVLLETLLLDPGVLPWLASLWQKKAGGQSSLPDVEAAISALQHAARGASSLDPSLSVSLVADATGIDGLPPDPLANFTWAEDDQPWTPVYLDWELSWFPTSLDPNGVETSWQLGDIDFEWTGVSVPDQSRISYVGRTLLNTDAPTVLARRIDKLLDDPNIPIPDFERQDLVQVSSALANADVLTQSLSGLNELMIQQTLNVAIGNQSDDTTPDDASVPSPPLLSDESDRPFQPLRSGHFVINRLWVVDAYGQVLKTENPSGIVVPYRSESTVTPGNGNSAFVQLPPRLVQSARLDFQLLSAEDDATPCVTSDRASPICGWVAPNLLDGGLLVFDADGNAQGELLPVQRDDGTGLRWDAAPGLESPLGAPPTLANAHLQQMVVGLLKAGERGTSALAEVLALMDGVSFSSAWRFTSTSTLPLLIGQPLAVVRASVQLELAGDPSYDQAYAQTGQHFTNGFTEVALPLRIGDLGIRTNGVVGYYADDRYDELFAVHGYTTSAATSTAALLAGADPASTGSNAEELVASVTGGSFVKLGHLLALKAQENTGALARSGANGSAPQPTTLLVLMNATAALPAISGFLPVQSRNLPAGPVDAALRAMTFAFRTGPLLVDPQSVRMPLPTDIRGSWSFIRRSTVTTWSSDGVQASTSQAELTARPLQLFEGYLQLSGATPTVELLPVPRFFSMVTTNASTPIVPALSSGVDPASVLVSQTIPLVFTMTNDTGASIDVGMDFQITISLPVGADASTLIDPASASSVSASAQTRNFSAFAEPSLNAVVVTVVPTRATTVAAGGQITVVISNAKINDVANASGVAVAVQASVGTDQGPVQTLAIPKVDSGPMLVAYASPRETGLLQSTRIHWSAGGGAQIRLTGNGENQLQKLNGAGPVWSGEFDVLPNQSQSQTVYQIELQSASNSTLLSELVLVDLRPPEIDDFRVNQRTDLALDQQITFTWDTAFASSATLSPFGQVPLSEARGLQKTPGALLKGSQSTLPVTLSASGYKTPANSTIELTFADVAITYFCYAAMDDTSSVRDPVLRNAASNQLSSPAAGVFDLVVYGPNGPLSRSLGRDEPEVRYFGPYNPSVPAGKLTLYYWVNGFAPGDSLTLNPMGIALGVDSSGKGQTDVTLETTSELTLVAVLSGVTISNTITVTVTKGQA